MIWILDTCVNLLLDQYNLDTEIDVTNHMPSNYQQTDTPPLSMELYFISSAKYIMYSNTNKFFPRLKYMTFKLNEKEVHVFYYI